VVELTDLWIVSEFVQMQFRVSFYFNTDGHCKCWNQVSAHCQRKVIFTREDVAIAYSLGLFLSNAFIDSNKQARGLLFPFCWSRLIDLHYSNWLVYPFHSSVIATRIKQDVHPELCYHLTQESEVIKG
jgi:hypothetical protein